MSPQQVTHTTLMGFKSKALTQAYELGDLLYARSKANDVSNEDLVMLTKAWDQVQERKRIMRGKPLPGSLKPTVKRKVRRSFNVPIVPEEDVPVIDVETRAHDTESGPGSDDHTGEPVKSG